MPANTPLRGKARGDLGVLIGERSCAPRKFAERFRMERHARKRVKNARVVARRDDHELRTVSRDRRLNDTVKGKLVGAPSRTGRKRHVDVRAGGRPGADRVNVADPGREAALAVQRDGQDTRVGPERLLSPVSPVCVPVDDCNAVQSMR
jgi:hypothetical protein